jgi:hypothetical protein
MKNYLKQTVKTILLLTTICSLNTTVAQAPQSMSYQSVIRNSSDVLISNSNVGMKISILQGSANGTAVYVETHLPTTNNNGLATLKVGDGTPVTGTFSSINWANGPYFIKTETDPAGGNNYTIIGTSQLQSVPYALSSADNKWTPNGIHINNNNSGNVGIGTATPTSKLDLNGDLSLNQFLFTSPGTTYNSFNTNGMSYVRLNITNNTLLNGISVPADADGKILVLHFYLTNGTIIINNESAAASASQRLNNLSFGNIIFSTQGENLILSYIYSKADQRWILLSKNE